MLDAVQFAAVCYNPFAGQIDTFAFYLPNPVGFFARIAVQALTGIEARRRC